MSARTPFLDWLRCEPQCQGLGNEALLAVVLPLFRAVQDVHAAGQVAPLLPAQLHFDAATQALGFDAKASLAPRQARDLIEARQAEASSALEVVGHARQEHDLAAGRVARTDLAVAEEDGLPERPIFVPGYRSWEQALGHHDELTDLFLLGQLLASVATGLDFTQREQLGEFVEQRENLFQLVPRLHPVIAGVIGELTELNRHRRARDLGTVILRLENFREQPAADFDLGRIAGLAQAAPKARTPLILGRLRDRLFEISRRNRLIYFKPSQQTVNLTIASVPLRLDHRSIRPEQLCYWHAQLAETLSRGETLPLGRYVRFEDHPYIAPALDKAIAAARRDRHEFGFQQLRLVLVFLRWHNLRENPAELIESPLLLLPVELSKKKGVRDSYELEPAGTVAQVNPALRFHLHQLYRLELPEEIDLRSQTLADWHAQLQAQIHASEPAVTLRLVERPQVRLVQERARLRVEAYRRRQQARGEPVRAAKVSHSYAPDDYRPLGLALFRAHVQTRALSLRLAAGGTVGFGPPAQLTADAPAGLEHVTERQMVEIGGQSSAAGNPYVWEFDLGALTLGNFNTRKMSLVHDYGALLDEAPACPAFETIFSPAPRQVGDAPPPLPLPEQHFVVPADAAQASAVARGRAGDSFIIQGPPGTGKSQTITNLIADYVARGRRVLFVCEKRAAIDVVFHRLRQQGLGELCCLIHDSQTDKKEFVQNLRGTYEAFLQPAPELAEAERSRCELTAELQQEIEALSRFSAHMTTPRAEAGGSPRELLDRLLTLRSDLGEVAALPPEDEEQLPAYALWPQHGDLARRLARALREAGENPVLARHPLRLVPPGVLESERPVAELRRQLEAVEEALETVENGFALLADPAELTALPLSELGAVLEFSAWAQGLAGCGLSGAWEPKSAAGKALQQFERESGVRTAAWQKATEKAAGWSDPFDPQDAAEALALAKAREQSVLRFVLPAWWRLRGELQRRYDFSRHQQPPTFVRLLEALVARQRAEAALTELRAETQRAWRHEDPDRLLQEVSAWRERLAAGPSTLRSWARRLLAQDSADLASGLSDLWPDFQRLRGALGAFPVPSRLAFGELGALLAELRRASDLLPEFAPLLRELQGTDPTFARALREISRSVDALEFASARRAFLASGRDDRRAARFDGAQLDARLERFHARQRRLLSLNAATLRHGVRARFLEHVRLSGLPAAQLTAEEKALKKEFSAGRRELEHEFGKSMRFRSIRELAAGPSGLVLRDLKPVWLMSPLSVSDTLPLEADWFDVVVFDEASQIPLEEAIPAIFRAPQVIVVGDEMQLPPTSFFGAAHEDEEGLIVEEGGERVALALEADSFLTQAAVSLPSTLLAWHYRSRSEALISYSNAAFYQAKLLTIPDRTVAPRGRGALELQSADEAERAVDELLARSISYHRLAHGRYLDRRNLAEAEYIARLVRALLRRETGQSIGVVAFSEAQQTAIEEAIEKLAEADADFAARFEAETRREEDDQFCGLFLKNLENVQGDERDLIILSICYAKGPEGRMLMNFGPINQRGGEKRLNVIFSRAKRHMAVVASIGHGEITNDWNDGANALKNFLRYAEHVSRGEPELASGVLAGLQTGARRDEPGRGGAEIVAEQLAAALRARGQTVRLAVGQSRFRCDLALAAPGGEAYALTVQIDGAQHYANPDIQERYCTRPGLLEAFGWRVLHVMAKDWFEDAERVLQRIERALREPTPSPAEDSPEKEMGETEEEEIDPAAEQIPAAAPLAAPDTSMAPPAPETPPAPVSEYRRYLEFVGDGSRKFWEVTVREERLVVRFGRLGTAGQTQEKQSASTEAARAKAEALAAEKRAKGYEEK
ncbi:MAG: WGR domain-containing protein [Verrucomicrobia bacterium]|nr:WGR domain-containing protein [Verrucomicrobiota bacterium]